VPKNDDEITQAQFVRMRVANVVLQWLKLVRLLFLFIDNSFYFVLFFPFLSSWSI